MIDRLEALERRYEELGDLMSQPDVVADMSLLQKYAREHSQLTDTVRLFRELKRTDAGIADARSILNDGADEDLRELAIDELRELEVQRETHIEDLKRALVPKDPNDDRNCIVEIRAAAGGEEAALFAAELYRMYALYAER